MQTFLTTIEIFLGIAIGLFLLMLPFIIYNITKVMKGLGSTSKQWAAKYAMLKKENETLKNQITILKG